MGILPVRTSVHHLHAGALRVRGGYQILENGVSYRRSVSCRPGAVSPTQALCRSSHLYSPGVTLNNKVRLRIPCTLFPFFFESGAHCAAQAGLDLNVS